MKLFAYLYLIIFFLFSCQESKQQNNVTTASVASNEFILPEIPSNLSSTQDKNTYLLMHYWDHFDFNNEQLIDNSDVSEQAFVDFIDLFKQNNEEVVNDAIHHLLSEAEKKPSTFTYFKELFTNYLYNPNSPMRNEVHYEAVLAYLIDSESTSEEERIKSSIILSLITKNKVGTQATPFNFTLSSGQLKELSSVNTPYTMLFFYEPGCSSCEHSISQMKDQPLLNNLIAQQELTILAIYTLGDQKAWKEYQTNIPSNWVNGNNGDQIHKNQLYDLKASPTMYLLDNQKRVILKDCYLPEILNYLQ